MTVITHQEAQSTYHNISETQVVERSTYKERVLTDRIVMAILLLATIIFAISIS